MDRVFSSLTVFAGILALVFRSTCCQEQLTTVIPGDVIFGGLFDVNELENGACGKFSPELIHEVVAVTWFLQSLNNRNYIPGVKIGFDVFRTCSTIERSLDGALRLLTRYRVEETTNSTTVLFGLLGPERTEGVKIVSRWLSSLPDNKRLLQISGSATGMGLSNHSEYPNFFRVIPSDSIQVKVLEQLLVQLGWNYIAIAYDDDNYGRSVAGELRRLARERDICIPVYVSLPIDIQSDTFDSTAIEIVNQISSSQNGLVRGIVIVASSSSLRRLIQKLSEKSYVSLVLGEAVGLQQTNLQSTPGTIVPIARGALVTSPPYFPLPEFQSFWKDLWTNQTLFTDYVGRIPWLAGLFQQVAQCNFTQSGCWDRRRQDVNSVEKTVSLYTGYHLKAAAVLAAFLKQQHTANCSGSNISLCTNLTNLTNLISDSSRMLTTFRKSPISLSEFGTELAEFGNMTVAFDENGDILLTGGESNYTVYNVQENNDKDYVFKQVATYADSKLTVQESDVVFYRENGSSLSWSQRLPAQCDCNTDCLQCKKDVSDEILFIKGDFYIVGILSIHEKNPLSSLTCGKIKTLAGADLAESVAFAVKEINKKEGMFADILPGRKIGLLLINSCSSPLVVRQRLLDLHTGRLPLPDTNHLNSSILLSNIMGYVGAYFSGDSIAAAEILTGIGRPFVQVSASSTSSDLKDRVKYPYFMRLVPADDVQAQILLDVAVKLNSTYIQVMYDKMADYAQGLVRKLEEALTQNYTNICIAQKIAVTSRSDVSEYKWIKDELRKKSAAKLVIVVLYDVDIEKVMDAILPDLTSNDNFLFLASDSWGKHQELIQGKTKLEGSLVLSQDVLYNSSFHTYFTSLDPTKTENVWLRYFWEARKNCYFDKSFERKGKTGLCPENIASDYVDDPLASLHIQAVNALVIGFNQTLNKLCGSAARQLCSAFTSGELVKTLKNIRLDMYNRGERTQVFDDNGDGVVGFKILHVTRDRTSPVDAVIYTEVGSWTNQKLTLDESKLTPPGGEQFSAVCPNPAECSACFKQAKQTTISNGDSDDITVPVVVGVSLPLAAAVIVLLVFVVHFWRRLKVKGRRGTTIRFVPGARRSGDSTLHLSNSFGSCQESNEAEPCEHYASLGNSAQLCSGDPILVPEDKASVHSETSLPPPLCNGTVQEEWGGYITPVY